MKKYYKVVAKCGHVKSLNYVLKTFAVHAESASSASQQVKNFPRVKKHLKTCITSCNEITNDEYTAIKNANLVDGYFRSHTHREQMIFSPNISDEIISFEPKLTKRSKDNLKRRMIEDIELQDMIKYIINEGYVHQSVLKI